MRVIPPLSHGVSNTMSSRMMHQPAMVTPVQVRFQARQRRGLAGVGRAVLVMLCVTTGMGLMQAFRNIETGAWQKPFRSASATRQVVQEYDTALKKAQKTPQGVFLMLMQYAKGDPDPALRSKLLQDMEKQPLQTNQQAALLYTYVEHWRPQTNEEYTQLAIAFDGLLRSDYIRDMKGDMADDYLAIAQRVWQHDAGLFRHWRTERPPLGDALRAEEIVRFRDCRRRLKNVTDIAVKEAQKANKNVAPKPPAVGRGSFRGGF